jgi:glycosyltransferase involved in cell wall biosynthesis
MLTASILLLPFIFFEKIVRPLESSWSWWIAAYFKGLSLARKKPFDLIYSTGGAFAAHIAANALKHATGTPWLAEVHDPMIVPGKRPNTAQENKQFVVESQICTSADVAIWFTEEALASVRQRHPQLGDRGKMMLPGIDNPFLMFPPYLPSNKFVVGHFGSLSSTRNLGLIIQGLELLIDRCPDLIGVVELHIYGGLLDRVSAARLEGSPIQPYVRIFGRIETDPTSGLSGRMQVINKMRSMDVLLLLHGDEPICAEYIPSKLYEYLWMQRPILAIVHRNMQMAQLLHSLGHLVVSSEESEQLNSSLADELALMLKNLYATWKSQGLPDNELDSPHTTRAAVSKLICWVRQVKDGRK